MQTATRSGTRTARQLARDYSTAKSLARSTPERAAHWHEIANDIWREANERSDRTRAEFRRIVRTDRHP